jgi:hypothetical protein
MKNILILLSILLILQGCNPMRRIDMKNRSGGEVAITWKLQDRDSIYKSDFFISNSDEVSFEIKPGETNDVKMTFGVGNWKPAALYAVTEKLESLEIKSASGTIVLKSPDDIYNFLINRRRGLTNRRIVIEIID